MNISPLINQIMFLDNLKLAHRKKEAKNRSSNREMKPKQKRLALLISNNWSVMNHKEDY